VDDFLFSTSIYVLDQDWPWAPPRNIQGEVEAPFTGESGASLRVSGVCGLTPLIFFIGPAAPVDPSLPFLAEGWAPYRVYENSFTAPSRERRPAA
jgi:hypothetical protein